MLPLILTALLVLSTNIKDQHCLKRCLKVVEKIKEYNILSWRDLCIVLQSGEVQSVSENASHPLLILLIFTDASFLLFLSIYIILSRLISLRITPTKKDYLYAFYNLYSVCETPTTLVIARSPPDFSQVSRWLLFHFI